jgi:hypothetical protein
MAEKFHDAGGEVELEEWPHQHETEIWLAPSARHPNLCSPIA